MRQAIGIGFAFAGLVCLVGCAPVPDQAAIPGRAMMVARYAASPIMVDGRLDEAVWGKTLAYALHLDDTVDADVQEGGEARFAWDEENLYLGIRYTDSDVVAEGSEKNALHFQMGDVAELFLKPLGNTVYWELYVTPHSKTSTFCFPSWSRNLPSTFAYEMDIAVAGSVQGTLNDWSDRDTGWTGEMAIPIRELEKYGDTFASETWTVLVARYNYSRYLEDKGPELTMTPRLPKTDYHHQPGYALLVLEK